jgi:EipB-like
LAPAKLSKAADTSLIGVFILSLSIHPAAAVPQAASVDLAPHRAIYDMTLHEAVSGSNVSDVRGRLVFDFEGSTCAGFSLKSRLVTEIVDRDGNTMVTDLRSSTWETANGDKFRFENSQYVDQRLSEQVTGQAARRKKAGAIDITLDKPQHRRLKLEGKALFPTQHSIAILEAAKAGYSVLQADVYDGSEQGKKLLQTTTFIGKPSVTAAAGLPARIANAKELSGMQSWPVSISYYDVVDNPRQDTGVPAYELSFRLFANGVSQDLLINYGGFSISGDLSGIEFHAPKECPTAKR